MMVGQGGIGMASGVMETAQALQGFKQPVAVAKLVRQVEHLLV